MRLYSQMTNSYLWNNFATTQGGETGGLNKHIITREIKSITNKEKKKQDKMVSLVDST